jgi:hypothetical protein
VPPAGLRALVALSQPAVAKAVKRRMQRMKDREIVIKGAGEARGWHAGRTVPSIAFSSALSTDFLNRTKFPA